MQGAQTRTAATPVLRLPAWIFSVALHGALFLALAVAIDRSPRGASEGPVRAAGIVLKRVSAEGELYAGEDDAGERTTAADEEQSPEPVSIQPPPEHLAATQADRAVAEQATPVATPGAPSGAGQPDAQSSANAAGRPGSPDGSGYAKVSVFGVEGSGNKFVYVFDRSSSMEGAPLAAAKRQLIESLNSLDAVHQFHIIFFNHRLRLFDVTGGGRRVAFASDRNKKLAANFVGGITADGGTDRFMALKQALAFRPDVIFFLTDADDPMSASEMADVERIYSRLGTSICVIEFGHTPTPPKSNFLTELATQSGGQYGYINTAKLTR
jgi:hypothetical protein